MHVLFIAEDFPAARQAVGGVRVSVSQQAHGLAGSHRVTVVTMRRLIPPLERYRRWGSMDGSHRAASEPSTASSANDSSPARLRVLDYRYMHLPLLWPLTEPLQTFAIGLWAILRHARDVDILHGHRIYMPGVVAVLLGKFLRRPSIATVYGSDIHRDAIAGNRLRRGWIRFGLRHATRVVAVAESLTRALAKLGVDDERCRYVPSGVDVDRFTPATDLPRLRHELGLSPAARVLLSTSMFAPIKGHRHLVTAFARLHERLPDCMLVLASDGPLRAQIEQQVREAGLGERVRFTGFVDFEAMPRWVAAADVLVLPSDNEGMPLCVLECFACGRPLVGSEVGGIPELVNDERFGILVPPADPEALADALERALERRWDPELLRARASLFSWTAVVQQLESVYGEILGRRRAPADADGRHPSSA